MTKESNVLLLLFQLIALIGLFVLDVHMSGSFPNMLRLGFFTILFITTAFLLLKHFRSRKRLQHMVTQLRRVVDGNLKTRLFAKGDHLIDEIKFSVNDLIEQLEEVQIQTIQSQAARRRLLSSISHDIRTPLTSIIGYVDALHDNIAVSAEEKQQYLDIVSRKSKALKQMIDEIFTMAKLDADEMPLKPEALDFAEMARESLIEFLPDLKKYDIQLQVRMPEKPCIIMADRLSLMRIMGNIMKNAVYYGREGQVVAVELIEIAHEYQLLIWDKGPGISQEDIRNVFERMYRSDQSRSLLHGGSGLGLAIAKALVEKQGGRIWAESVAWEKTTFGFSIPKHKQPHRF